jgi:hypothetical protein
MGCSAPRKLDSFAPESGPELLNNRYSARCTRRARCSVNLVGRTGRSRGFASLRVGFRVCTAARETAGKDCVFQIAALKHRANLRETWARVSCCAAAQLQRLSSQRQTAAAPLRPACSRRAPPQHRRWNQTDCAQQQHLTLMKRRTAERSCTAGVEVWRWQLMRL